MNQEQLEELKQQLNEVGYKVKDLDVNEISKQDLNNDFCNMYPQVIVKGWLAK